MKTVQYDLRIIHRKKVAIGAINRKEIDRILRDMITSGEALNMEGGGNGAQVECDTQYQQATPLDCQNFSGNPPAACQGNIPETL